MSVQPTAVAGKAHFAQNRTAAHKAAWRVLTGRDSSFVAAAMGIKARCVRRMREEEHPDILTPAERLERAMLGVYHIVGAPGMARVLAPIQEILHRFGYAAIPVLRRRPEPLDCPRAGGEFMRRAGQLLADYAKAIADGSITHREAQELGPEITSAEAALEGIRAAVAARLNSQEGAN